MWSEVEWCILVSPYIVFFKSHYLAFLLDILILPVEWKHRPLWFLVFFLSLSQRYRQTYWLSLIILYLLGVTWMSHFWTPHGPPCWLFPKKYFVRTKKRCQVTDDRWHVTRDTLHMTHSVGWTCSQNFSSLALPCILIVAQA